VTVVTPAAGSYAALIVADNPESWWKLNEASGTRMFDSMGRHDGVYTNISGNPVTFGAPGALYALGSDRILRSADPTRPTVTLWATPIGGAAKELPLVLGDALFILVNGDLVAVER
jgi:hypothetical protein